MASALAVAAHAQPESDASLEVTIRLLPENAVGPQEITRRIELPPAAAAEAEERPGEPRPDAERGDGREPGPGIDGEPGGADARERARGEGRDTATDARERGREAAEQARDNRENVSRPDDGPRGRPDDAGPPGRPDDASPPRDPPGRPGDANPPSDPPGRPDDAGPPGGAPGNP